MKRFSLLLLVAILFAACTNDSIEELQSPIGTENYVPESITVGFEGDGDETRIQLQNGKTVWTKNDQVSVFYLSNANQKWQYYGETGSRTAELKRADAGSGSTKINKVVVVYPYNEDYYINPESCNIKAFMPAEQTYLEDSYGNNGNIMISSSEYNQFSLKSVCGWLKLQIMGDGEKIKSIKLCGNNGEQVAGELYINSVDATAALAADMGSADDNNAGGSLVFDDTILEEVTLDCGEGVALGKSATMFYIALPPQTFTQGIYVAIEDTEGYVMEQSTDKALTIERNHIQPMAAFEFFNPATPSAPAPASNEIWYTATAKVEPTFDDALTFGADVVSNVWDSETKRGVISFNGDVTMIGDGAFDNCDKLTAITLPEGVTTIGQKAFYDCDGLIDFTIPDGVTSIGNNAFYSCGKLASVTIGNSVTTIGYAAFAYCDLTSVTIPDSVTTIVSGAFRGCDSLTSVTIPDSVTTIGVGAFGECSSIKEFKGKFATEDGRSLIVDNTIIAYANASGTTYTIPDSVTSIGDYAFGYCYSLTSITIPNSVTSIGDSAFRFCHILTSVTIPDSVTTIGVGAFECCTSLEEFKGKFAADNGRCLIMDNTIIAYANASGTTYTIPDSVTTIGEEAFYHCYSLTSVTIPDSVTAIGVGAFFRCKSLTSVTIPDSVTTIGYNAFYNCTSLTSVYCKATTPPTLGNNSFGYNGSGRKIYVPASDDDSIINAYKSAEGWSEYAEYIVEFETTYDYMPTLPTDPDPKNLTFNHRAVVIDHTGVNCGYCPGMTDKLLALAKTEWHQHYNEVTCHAGGFASGDPANSAAANALNQMQSPEGYPNININFHTATVSNYAQSTFLNYMGQALEAYIKKDGADVGIAMAVEGDSTNIYCAAQVKAKESKEYKVVAWLLENNIYSPNQAGATKDYHKIYNYALRNISGEYSRNNVSGESIGVLEAGQTHDCTFTLPIVSTKWKWENMGVLVIVSAKDDNNQWEVVNSAYCPVNESKAYEYIE